MDEQSQPRIHVRKRRRDYEYGPRATHLYEGEMVAWITTVPNEESQQLYVVIRYKAGGRTAWIESDPFGQDQAAAQAWAKDTMKQLSGELSAEEKGESSMPENPNSIATWLEAKQILQEKLKAAGIPEEEWIGLHKLLDVVTDTDPDTIRANQFTDDARNLLTDLKAASEKNVARTSAFLRQFAEHVVRKIAPDGTENEAIDARVDALPTLTSWLEKD